MNLLQQIVARAKGRKQRIVLPEATEERTLRAADWVLADEVADIILIGNPEEIAGLAEQWGLTHLDKATIIDPDNNLKTGDADGQISGALSTTGETLRPALQIIKCAPGISCVSGAMLLVSKQKGYGEDGVLVIGDVAVTPVPDASQLAQIAVCTAQTAKSVACFAEPRVAMLSFSTKGSAKHEVVDKVTEATRMAQEMAPELKIDGELQADAALVPAVAAKKAPGSEIAGHANVLVVPNLEVGNISYKLVQRLGDAKAVGPILQGIARPVNDLSRGCSVEDIYYMVAITACQAMDSK